MPLYIDRHDGPVDIDVPVTAAEVAEAHRRDLEVQGRYGVTYLGGFIDLERMRGFCIVRSPSKEAAEAVHREAHGNTANHIIEVEMDLVEQFLGAQDALATGELTFESPMRTILFTDIEGSTPLIGRLGDEAALELQREHDSLVQEAVRASGGRLIKHTGDGVMACFSSAVRAVEGAVAIQTACQERSRDCDWPIRVRIGLSAGEPVVLGTDDLFGLAVNLARRVCDACPPGEILVPHGVRELLIGKGFRWLDRGPAQLRGFDEPIHLYALDRAEAS